MAKRENASQDNKKTAKLQTANYKLKKFKKKQQIFFLMHENLMCMTHPTHAEGLKIFINYTRVS